MDHAGIGLAMRGMAHTYITTARQSGRTTALVLSLKPGDRVVCGDPGVRRYLDRMIKDRGIEDVAVIVVPPGNPRHLLEHKPSEGFTYFEHTWVEQYYLRILARGVAEIDNLQRQASGYGDSHPETQLQCREEVRWGGR